MQQVKPERSGGRAALRGETMTNGRKRQESELTPKAARLVAASLAAPTWKEAAALAGVSDRYARDLRATPAFREALRIARDQVLQDATARAAGGLVEAVDVLREVMSDADAPSPARVGAARVLLSATPALLEAHDLAERVSALEAAQPSPPTPRGPGGPGKL